MTKITSTLQMTRAHISIPDLHRWMGSRHFTDQDQAMHHLMVECFGNLAPKPFRLIVPRGTRTGILYGYGQADAEILQETAAIQADPLQAKIMPLNTIDGKPMPSAWKKGKLLAVEVRIRPIIRRARGSGREEAETDVFQARAGTFQPGEMTLSREQVYAQWLQEKIHQKGAASMQINNTKLAHFQRTRIIRRPHTRHNEGPDALMRTVMEITDPDSFNILLSQGIGRHRAYGYGMLLIKPIRD